MKRLTTRDLVLCAFFTALIAVFSWLSIPVGPVPVNLALLGVLLSGSVLGSRGAILSIGAYLLLGLAGVPVFASFRAGAAALLGPSGGYLVGYLPAAVLAGLKSRARARFHRAALGLRMLAGILVCYTLGTLWFMFTAGYPAEETLALSVLPFIPGDIAKLLLAVFLTDPLCGALRKL